MSVPNSDNKRIAKNTLFLYFRMIIVMIVSLYTTRVVLNILGDTDYGIYHIIAGIIIIFTFINSALSNATQRYLSYSLGKDDLEQFNKTFSSSILGYLLISLVIFLIAESGGLWFVNHKLSIPPDRMDATRIVYHITILTFILKILRIPFESTIISHERMSFYAYLSIIEAALNLLVVFLLKILPGDKLIGYATLMLLVPLVVTLFFIAYSFKRLNCKYVKKIERGPFVELLQFSGWTLLGTSANVVSRQGGNILLNIFFGVTVNAAFGIANQVSAAISSLVNSFQLAFKPQITKLYAANQFLELNALAFQASKWSAYIMLILVVPISFHMTDWLSLWLKNIPPYTSSFSILLLIYCMIDAAQAPLWLIIASTAKIKTYEIWFSVLYFLNIPISYWLFKVGFSPMAMLSTYITLNFISAIVRTFYIKVVYPFPSMKYIREVFIPMLILSVIVISMCFFLKIAFHFLHYEFIATTIISILASIIIIYVGGLSRQEKAMIANYSKKAIYRIIKR